MNPKLQVSCFRFHVSGFMFNTSLLPKLLVPPKTSFKKAMHALSKSAERILFVVDKKHVLLGTLTDGDIRRGILHGRSFGDTVDTIMNTNYIFISAKNADISFQAKQLMVKNKIEQIPIIDEARRISDVIFLRDLFQKKEAPRHKPVKHKNKVVIMAGGKGTRLDPFTKILPKPLIPIGETPIIEIIMDRFAKSGFDHFLYTLNYKKEYIKTYLKEMNSPYTIDWVEEENYLGTAGSLCLLAPSLHETFFVTNCDSLLDLDFSAVLHWHKSEKAALTIIGCHKQVNVPFGVLELTHGKLKKITEKPIYDVTINTGVYVMEPHLLAALPPKKKFDMTDLIEKIAKKEKISVYPIHEGWMDVGQWKEYKESLKKFEGEGM